MSIWLIEPRDPLIARDGRPAASGGSFRTLDFPYPSTIAGAVRTRLASGAGTFDLRTREELDDLLRIEVGGPLLAELEGDDVLDWLAPAPRDARIVEGEDGRPALVRLRPRAVEGGQCDGLAERGQMAVGAPDHHLPPPPLSALPPPPDHPQRERGTTARPEEQEGEASEGGSPLPFGAGARGTHGRGAGGEGFWHWRHLEAWLHPAAGLDLQALDPQAFNPQALGLPKLLVERRSHVAIQPGERVGMDGMLFETAGLRFLSGVEGKPLAPRRLALALRCGGGAVGGRALALAEQVAPLGGERRLARWRRAPRSWPAMPAAVLESIQTTRRARLVLLTPACFSGGALPGWNGEPWPGQPAVRITVRAACVPRPEIVSGWDLAKKNEPGKARGQAKPTRRLAAAGSVYFVEIDGGSADDAARWCAAVWLAAVSDSEQDRRDGFGLAVLGAWEEEGS